MMDPQHTLDLIARYHAELRATAQRDLTAPARMSLRRQFGQQLVNAGHWLQGHRPDINPATSHIVRHHLSEAEHSDVLGTLSQRSATQ